jgi:hypothetical protein
MSQRTETPAATLDVLPLHTKRELCFFVEAGGVVRVNGQHGIYSACRQLTFRCGMCASPFASEADMLQHAQSHFDGGLH